MKFKFEGFLLHVSHESQQSWQLTHSAVEHGEEFFFIYWQNILPWAVVRLPLISVFSNWQLELKTQQSNFDKIMMSCLHWTEFSSIVTVKWFYYYYKRLCLSCLGLHVSTLQTTWHDTFEVGGLCQYRKLCWKSVAITKCGVREQGCIEWSVLCVSSYYRPARTLCQHLGEL